MQNKTFRSPKYLHVLLHYWYWENYVVWSSLKVSDPTILHLVLGLWTLIFKTYGFRSYHFLTHGLSLLGTSSLSSQCYAFFFLSLLFQHWHLYAIWMCCHTTLRCLTDLSYPHKTLLLVAFNNHCLTHRFCVFCFLTHSILNCQYYLMLCCETYRLVNLHPWHISTACQ